MPSLHQQNEVTFRKSKVGMHGLAKISLLFTFFFQITNRTLTKSNRKTFVHHEQGLKWVHQQTKC